VAVDSQYRGKRLGLRLISVIKEIAKASGCYKITLDCKESNMPFYEQNGFKPKERQMAWYREDEEK
jgi:glucosamine-phosphate N-acetyltransferase